VQNVDTKNCWANLILIRALYEPLNCIGFVNDSAHNTSTNNCCTSQNLFKIYNICSKKIMRCVLEI